MNDNHVFCSKNIFLVYCGLHAAGYDLCPRGLDPAIKTLISSIKKNDLLTDYFKNTRLESCPVNPYWPRGFLLALASFYYTGSNNYSESEEQMLDCYLDSLDHISDEEKDEDTKQWLYKLPSILTEMSTIPELSEAWTSYKRSLAEFEPSFERQILDTMKLFTRKMKIPMQELPEFRFIPNYLQAPQITDPVFYDNTIYLLCHTPDRASIIHELLHYSLAKYLDDNFKEISRYAHLLKPVLPEMLRYRYAWDDGVASWANVFDEHIMRAASLWLTYDSEKVQVIGNAYAKEGFRYVPGIIECFQKEWKGMESFDIFLTTCLKHYMRI